MPTWTTAETSPSANARAVAAAASTGPTPHARPSWPQSSRSVAATSRSTATPYVTIDPARIRQTTSVRAPSDAIRGSAMRKIQSQGVHHITIVGAARQTAIDFWEGLLGMPFVFEQPNLDNEAESHLYFDPGDGRLITVFTKEDRAPDPRRTPTDPGCVHHIAINVSQAVFKQVSTRLEERGVEH